MITYELGDGVTIDHEVRGLDLALTDANAAITLTDPTGAPTTPGVTHVSLGYYRVPTFEPTKLGTWTYVWRVTGPVTDVAYGAFRVVDGTLAPAGSYAARSDLAGVIPSIPDNVDQLLVRASREVTRALIAAVYDPTDPVIIQALRDATVEQVAGSLAGGDKTGLGASSTPAGFTIGRITVQKPAGSTDVPRTGGLVDQAFAVLQAAGLTGHAPWTF